MWISKIAKHHGVLFDIRILLFLSASIVFAFSHILCVGEVSRALSDNNLSLKSKDVYIQPSHLQQLFLILSNLANKNCTSQKRQYKMKIQGKLQLIYKLDYKPD